MIEKEYFMSRQTGPFLERLHQSTGVVLSLCNRLLAGVVALGSIFCLLVLGAVQLAHNPEKVLHTQSFNFNYNEFSQVDAQSDLEGSAAKAVMSPKDENWDGVLAGVGLGYTVGRNIPLVGSVAGPLVGALIGYRLDSRI